jgi:1,4-dihydroxy-2-naphthoate octaprenyltransferase
MLPRRARDDANGTTKARAWLLAVRPPTLLVGVAPVVVGAASVRGPVRTLAAVAALAGALLIQIGTNLANDVYDHEKGADGPARVGPLRATQAGLLSAREVRGGMALAFALAALVGLYLSAVGGPAIIAIGVLSIASGIAYTGGPWPLGYHGLGDLFVLAFFGLVAVCGTALVAGGSVPPISAIAAIPVGALATAVLVVNNLRDRGTDVVCNKRTLVVRFGRAFGVVEYAALLALAYVVPIAIAAAGARSPWVLLPLLTAPLGVWLVRFVAREDGASLNAGLGWTARLLLAHAALFAIGLRVG